MRLIFLLFFVFSCKEGIETHGTNNPGIKVDLLFVHNGCSVYRFSDDGYKYYTDCTETFWNKRSGKVVKKINISTGSKRCLE